MNYISHHGIEGQQWGVRNGPPYPLDKATKKKVNKEVLRQLIIARKPLEDHTLPKGTGVYRVTPKIDDTVKYKYVTYTDHDNDIYRGGWVRKSNNADSAYQQTYKTNSELKIAGLNTVNKEAAKILLKNEKLGKESIKDFYNLAYGNRLFPEELKEVIDDNLKNYKNISTDELVFKSTYSLGMNPALKEKIADSLRKQGYNAMSDRAAIGGERGWRREGYDPLIILDNSVITKISTERIDPREERKAEKRANKDSDKINWYY